MAIDPVTLTVLGNAFVNVCREMGVTMMRTAFSPIFNEGLDFSCVLFDRRGKRHWCWHDVHNRTRRNWRRDVGHRCRLDLSGRWR